ncbi:hypothetical protein ACFOZY_05440 [Chungangia koreensis]|uniref:Uncharacterized protein n=1 Tax=Chungangia koreensis TaxID=752657 RepID=A0ABV8X3Y5_9LACT
MKFKLHLVALSKERNRMFPFSKDEKGYTLLLTLLLIVIIISLLTTFLFASVTQQKQIEQTDKSFEASSVAEMGAEKIRTIILTKYEDIKSELRVCVNTSKPEEVVECTETAISKVRAIKDSMSSYSLDGSSPKKYSVLPQVTSDNVFYQYQVKPFNSNSTVEQFKIEVVGVIPSNQKVINLTFNLPLAILEEKEPDDGGNNSGGLIDFPLESSIFPPPASLPKCSGKLALPQCKLDGNQKFTWDDFRLDRSTIYIDGSLDFKLNGKNKENEDLKDSTIYIRNHSDLYLSNPLTLKNGKIFVYDIVDFTFFSGLNLEMYIEQNANIVNHFDATNSKIVVGGNVTIIDKKTITITNTKMLIKGNLEADNHKNVFVKVDRGSTLYLQGAQNNIEQLIVYNNSKVCIDNHAKIDNLSIQTGGKVFLPATYSGTVPNGATKISNYNEECSLNSRNDYEVSPVLTEDDITSDVTYGN